MAKSEFLKTLANQFRNELITIKKDTELKVKAQEEYEKRLNSAIIGIPTANWGNSKWIKNMNHREAQEN